MASTIKEFLVGLAYRVDASTEARFLASINQATVAVAELAAGIEGAVLAVVLGMAKLTQSVESLWFMSQRTGASVENIKNFSFALEQVGGSAEGARAAIEALHRFMVVSPGGKDYIREQFGIDPNQDTEKILEQLGTKFKELIDKGQEYRARALASFVGIDERTMLGIASTKVGAYLADYSKLLKELNVNSQEAARVSNQYQEQLRKLGQVFDALKLKIILALGPGMTKDLDQFREYLTAHADAIVQVIEYSAKAILTAGEIIGRVMSGIVDAVKGVVDWFKTLTDSQQDIVKWITAIAGAFEILSLGILKSPMGRLLLLVSTLALFFEDWERWQHGKSHLIDWDKWDPIIRKFIKQIDEGTKSIGGVNTVLEIFAAFWVGAKFTGMIGGIGRLTGALTGLATWLARLVNLRLGLLGLAAGVGLIALETAQEMDKDGSLDKFDQFKHNPSNSSIDELSGLDQSNIKAKQQYEGMHPTGESATEDQKASRDYAHQFFKERGRSETEIAAILANNEAESSWNVRAFNGEGGGRGARGIMQLRGDRIDNFYNMFHRDPWGAPLWMQLAFQDWELSNTHANAGASIHNTNLPGAVAGMTRYYSIPKKEEMEEQIKKRTSLAGHILRRYLPGAPPIPPVHAPLDPSVLRLERPPNDPSMPSPLTALPRINLGPLGPIQPPVAPMLGIFPYSNNNNPSDQDNSKTVTLNQNTTVNVHGSSDPNATAGLVSSSQDRINEQLQRNISGTFR